MKFLKDNKRFSFKLGGTDAWECDYSTEVETTDDMIVTKYKFKNGLVVTNEAKIHDKFGAYEWVNYWENTSDRPTEIISELWDCDAELPLEHEDNRKWNSAYYPDNATTTKICAPSGSKWEKKEFYCDMNELRDTRMVTHIFPGESKKYATSGGRSSVEHAPFFRISKNASGYIVAVGWSGQWNAEITRTNDSVIFKSKIEDTNFRILPGEKFRTSSVVIMPYLNVGEQEAHNLWRRLLKEDFSPVGKGERPEELPLCAGIWGGMRTASVLERIEKIKNLGLPYDCVWMDAGWYGEDTKPTSSEFEGDWSRHTGDWVVSPLIHPGGLKDVSAAIHDAGMKFLLWFEPERIVPTVQIVKEHPDYLLQKTTDGKINDWSFLLDLGNEQAWQYCYDFLANAIEELQIDFYRQDFNISPLRYWRAHDVEDRCGITEIKYINGFYRLWDKLLERFPKLIIDDCASGGRRIDIETLKRSSPFWRSDVQCPANYEVEASQTHNQTFNMWMPYSGTGSGRVYDEYRVRSSYGASMTTNYSFCEDEKFCDTPEKVEFIKKYMTEYLRIRPYFSADFYNLTEVDTANDVWCAVQFNRPENNDGVIEVYRREDSPYETACFAVRGFDENREYLFEDTDGGTFRISGKILATKGFCIAVPEKRKAKIYFYKAV